MYLCRDIVFSLDYAIFALHFILFWQVASSYSMIRRTCIYFILLSSFNPKYYSSVIMCHIRKIWHIMCVYRSWCPVHPNNRDNLLPIYYVTDNCIQWLQPPEKCSLRVIACSISCDTKQNNQISPTLKNISGKNPGCGSHQTVKW